MWLSGGNYQFENTDFFNVDPSIEMFLPSIYLEPTLLFQICLDLANLIFTKDVTPSSISPTFRRVFKLNVDIM